jgi:hypothetical protein
MYTPRTNFSPSRSDIKIMAMGLDMPIGSPDTSVYYDPVSATIAGGTLLASKMSGDAARDAAETSAEAQLQASREAAAAQAFRPVGMTTRFGTSTFGFDGDRLTSAGYTASPKIQALQDRLSALYGTSLGQAEQAQQLGAPLGQAAQGLFGLGSQYLAMSPEQARQQFMQEQYAMLDPIRQREEQRLGASVFGRGRAGLSIGDMGQPELFTLASARRGQDLQLAAAAEQAAQQRAAFGAGLFGTGAELMGTQYGVQTKALSPFQTQFGLSQLLEQAALQPLDIGAQLGGRSATAGANVGQSLLQGGLGAAQTQLQGSLVGPSLMASNVSNFGQQYLQNQQQQNLFNQLYAPSGFGGMSGFNWQAPAPISIAQPASL